MWDLWLRLKVRYKLFFAFGSILALSIALISLVVTSTRSILRNHELTERIDEININSLVMNGLVKDFRSEGYKTERFQKSGQSELVRKFNDLWLRQDSLLQNIPEGFSDDREKLKQRLAAYRSNFTRLVELYQKRGFKDYGMEGKLRASIHQIEDSDTDYDRATMLMLRRHEKDFFLRKDLKYLKLFNRQVDAFDTHIRIAHDSAQALALTAMISHLENYRSLFNQIVELEQQIGLDRDTGLVGQISQDYARLNFLLSKVTQQIKKQKEDVINRSGILIFGLVAFQVFSGILLVAFYSNVLTKAIKETKRAITTLSKGSFPKPLPIRTKDEIGRTKMALNQLILRIKEAVAFAESLGEGNFEREYSQEYKNDVLAIAIQSLQKKLVNINQQQKLTLWTNEGLAKFSELLKEDYDSLEALADSVLNQLVTYTQSNQAALYSVIEEGSIKRIATYAYGRKRFVDQDLEVGQGLVGQAILEKETIYVTEVPAKYMKITSGLGEATASNLLIVPLKVKDHVVGAVELASFNIYREHHRAFVEKVSESIANLISSKMNAHRTDQLLENSKHTADLLAKKEEELREKEQDLKVVQEQLQKNAAEAEQTVRDLKQRLLHKEKEMSLLKLKLEEAYSA